MSITKCYRKTLHKPFETVCHPERNTLPHLCVPTGHRTKALISPTLHPKNKAEGMVHYRSGNAAGNYKYAY